MAFRNPFRRYASIDSSNYLQPKIENFLDRQAPESFHQAIRTLVNLRDVLRVAETIGRIGEIPNIQYYEQSVQWLNLQTGLGTWGSVPRIGSYDEITEEIANSFNSHVSATSSQITNQALFQQIQIMQGVIQNDVINHIKNNVTEPIEADFNRFLIDSRTSVIEKLDESHGQKESTLSTLFQTQLEEIRKTGQDAISSFEGARALANWSKFYADRVDVYVEALHGINWPVNAMSSKWHSFTRHRRSLSPKLRLQTCLQFRHGLWRNIRRGISIIFSKLNSYSGKRTIWFTLLSLGVLVFIFLNLVSIYGAGEPIFGIDFNKLRPQHNDTQIFAKVSVYLAVLLIPTLGYSFANKNFRIYSNLLEQYRHREVVAETIQGILARPRGDDTDEAVRKELANVASTALFEQKTVGHLSKNESSSASLMDIVRLFRS